MCKTLSSYVRSFGYKVADLTPDELNEVKEEFEALQRGDEILDGVLYAKKASDILKEERQAEAA